MTLTIVELLAAERTPGGLACTVRADDGRACSLLLPPGVAGALADAARAPAPVPPGSPVGEFPALELLSVQAVASDVGRGLLLETRQLGALVLALDDRRIAVLRRHLASLAALGDGPGADTPGPSPVGTSRSGHR